MRSVPRLLLVLLVLFTLLAITGTTFAAIHTTAVPKARVTTSVDNAKRTTLHGHVPPAVSKGVDLGRVEADKPVERLILVLKSDELQRREIRRIIDEQQDKRTKNFHQWVTPTEFGEHFGVHDADIAQITSWLASHGLTVDSVSKSKRSLRFSGTVGQLEEAFQTEMHYLQMPNGETHVSNTKEISIPTALKDVIAGVPTLNDFFRKSHKSAGTPVPIGKNSRMKPGPRYTSSSSDHLVAAADFATIYNSAPLLAQGINGTGVTIGIVGRSDILMSDIETYRTLSGLPANDPNFIHAGQDGGLLPGDDTESDLDVEISGGVAPNATVDFVIGTPTFLVDGITNSYEYLIENNIADIISSSYGDCESNEGTGGNQFNQQLFEQAAAQGTSVFIAEGDNGPAGCDDQGSQTYEVLGYASGAEEATWYSVGVGGTEFYADGGAGYSTYWSGTTNPNNEASALKYIPEYPWNESGVASPTPSGESSSDLTDLWAGSGAISAYYLRPPWQTGSGINNASDPTLTLGNGAAGNWVASVTLTNGGGSGYTTAPSVTFGTGCSDAPSATSVISSGSVVGLTFGQYTAHFQGFNCTSVPTVTFGAAPAGGTTATGTAVLGPMQNILPLIPGMPHRLTPDVSLNAASGHDGTIVCDEGICDEGYLDAYGGTSVAAPSMAGVQALIDQANGGRQGMPAYFYYQLANQQNATNCNSSSNPVNSSNCAFQDVTLGNTFICGQGAYSGKSAVCTAAATSAKIGFASTTGYDLATGLGSPNVANLASQWSNVTFNSSNTTLSLGSTSFTHGTSVTLSGTVSAGGSGTPTGDVAFIVSQGAIGDTNNETTGAMNGPVAFATLSGGSYSASLNNLPGGTYYVTARYGGDDNFASSLSAGVEVTVSSETGAVTITPNSVITSETGSTACTITPASSFTYGQDVLINFNVAGVSANGTSTGSLVLTLDGNPWETLPLDPNGNAFVFSGAMANPEGSSGNCLFSYTFQNVNTLTAGTHTIVASYAGDNSVQASTATSTITVAQISPGTLTFSAGGSTTGTAVIASGATVPLGISFPTVTALTTYQPSPGSSGPTGTITFTDTTTSTVLGTATVNPNVTFENQGSSESAAPEYLYAATALGSTSGITSTGAHSITASYSGDTNYTAATATSTVTVGGTTGTTVAVTASANPTTLAGVPTLTATVTTATAGAVSFYDGSRYLGAGSTVGTAHTSTLKVSSTYPFVGGSHSITAVYSGTGTTSQESVSPAFTENVTQGTLSLALSSKPTDNSSNTFSLGAVLNCVTGGCATGVYVGEAFSNVYAPVLSSVNFYDGATLLGSAPATEATYVSGGDSIWSAQLNVTLGAGSHSITATYTDTNYALATSNALPINSTTSQTLSWVTTPPASAANQSSFTVAATATSGLTPTYTAFGNCTNSGATYTMTKGTGTCLVIVSQAGNSTYGPAAQIQQSASATPGPDTVTFTTPAPSSAEYGSSFTVAASGLGSAAIIYTSDGVVCTNSGATYTMISGSGTCTVTASQAADSNFFAGSASESVAAAPAVGSVGVALTSGSNPTLGGQPVTFTATVSSDTGAVKGRKTTKRPKDLNGSVAWSGWSTASTDCPTSSVSGNPPQTATCTTSNLPGGTDTVTATYTASDSNHTTATGSISETVTEGNVVTFTTPAPSSAEYGASFTVAASGLGTGAITYTSDGVVCTNSGATYTMISGTGTCTVTATQAADAIYNSASASEYVAAAPAVSSVGVTLTSGANPSTFGDSITFTASVTSDTGAVKGRRTVRTTKRSKDLNGTVAWSGWPTASTDCPTSSVSGNSPETATCTTSALAGGTDTVTATYTANDGNHSSPTSGSISQTVNPANQTIACPGAPTTATSHSSFTLTCTAQTGLSYAASGYCTNVGATYTMTTGAVGKACDETVTAAASSNYNAATFSNSTTIATPLTPTVSVSAPASAAYGTTYTVTATTDASTTPVLTATPATICSISGTTVTMLSGTGMCTVTAAWAADDTYKAATATAKTTAAKIAPTVTFTGAPSTAAYLSTFTVASSTNTSVTPTMTATPASVCAISSGTVTMKSGTGTCTTTAKWAATTDYEATTLTQTTTAEMLATTTTITNTTAAANPLKVTVDFSVSNGTATPVVGSVTVRASSGETCTGTATAGHCLITFVSADAGSQTLTASYAGNANNSASTSASYPITVQ